MSAGLAHAWGGPAGTARVRVEPADFRVEEMLGFEPGGGGEHLWLWVGKRGANSEDVAHALARAAGIPRRRVGYSGRKDRHALTHQWFSLHAAEPVPVGEQQLGGGLWWVERAVRHPRKLRTGTHRANRFRLCLREFAGDRGLADERLGTVATAGFPNYFGPQRFGRAGENLQRARQALGGGRRRLSGMQLSAARSWLFNLVLDARVRDGSWGRALPDDALMLAGTHSLFRCRGDEEDLESRLAAHDIDPTGPMWGVDPPVIGPQGRERERTWLAREQSLCAALEALGVRHSRRPLRARPRDLSWAWQDPATLSLEFVLPRGAFATSLLREVAAVDDGAGALAPRSAVDSPIALQ